jgi:hypothetical protein
MSELLDIFRTTKVDGLGDRRGTGLFLVGVTGQLGRKGMVAKLGLHFAGMQDRGSPLG